MIFVVVVVVIAVFFFVNYIPETRCRLEMIIVLINRKK